MTHDASRGVDGDGPLLDWLWTHGFGPGSRPVRLGCVGGIGEQGVEKGSSLGCGEDGWCGVGVGIWVGGWDCHDERIVDERGSWIGPWG